MTYLGNKLKELRGSLSLYEVGGDTGIPRIEISRYERGQHLPTPKNLQKLADYYEVPYEDLRVLYFSDYFSEENVDRPVVLKWALTQVLNSMEMNIISAFRGIPVTKQGEVQERLLAMLNEEAT
ncbi:helix-turn-helix domain-containing protein [Vampirovibrio chlorellavorus]|uniref:helix-turn-helix domain-containing protein n=1 Tax=Vampirovibrio chlorellavorus TaxID=758823 RepID=UPI0026F31F94|nr:helix-turn-helix transcriptional regulator [Vampirovibrio chlorellavorus]